MKEIYSLNDLKNSRIFFDKNPPRFMTWFIGMMLLVIIFLLVWTTIAIKVEVVKVKGMVVTQDSTNISPDIQGVVEKVNYSEGDHVEKGDIIVTLKSNSQSAQTETAKVQDEFLNKQLVYYNRYEESIKTDKNLFHSEKSSELEFYNNVQYYLSQNKSSNERINTSQQAIKEQESVISQSSKVVEVSKKRIDEINARLKTLSIEIEMLQGEINTLNSTPTKQGQEVGEDSASTEPNDRHDATDRESLLAQKQTEQEELNNEKSELELKIAEEKSKIKSVEEQIDQLNGQIKSAEESKKNLKVQILSQIGQKRSEIELQSIESEGKYTANSEYESNYTLKAASDGNLHFNYDIKEGTVVQAATPIAKVLNDNHDILSLQVALPSNERSKVQKGNPVEIALDGILQTKFGVIEGKINEINIDSSVDQESGEAYFLTYIEPKDNQLKDKNGNIVSLKPGMTSEIRIKYEQNTWIQWLMEQINIFI